MEEEEEGENGLSVEAVLAPVAAEAAAAVRAILLNQQAQDRSTGWDRSSSSSQKGNHKR